MKDNVQWLNWKELFLILLVGGFLVSWLLVPVVDGVEWDNVKSYDSQTKEITLKEFFGAGETIAVTKLDTPQIYQVRTGYQKVAQFTINPYKDYENLLGGLTFYDLNNNNKEIEKKIDIKYWGLEEYVVDDYKCNENEKDKLGRYPNCIISGNHTEQRYNWVEWNKNAYQEKEVVVGLFTEVGLNEQVEWIPTIAGVKINEWAIYTSGNLTYTDGSSTVVVYSNNGTFNTTTDLTIDVLVVGGGGAGAKVASGGGGAGGYIYNTSYLLPAGNYDVVVGTGGVASAETGNGANGTNSSFYIFIAAGGGGSATYEANAYAGGSGGGASSSGHAAGAGIAGQGFAGGTGDGAGYLTGGGGGASQVGFDAIDPNAGAGGNGLYNSINGTNVTYAGGGGGGAHATKNEGLGGTGGGGNGNKGTNPASNGTNGLGGGGGGADNALSGGGGSGIVIIRYSPSPITVTLNSPANASTVSSVNQIFNCSVVSAFSLVNITFYLWSNFGNKLCYQETANETTTCGGLDTGYYSNFGAWSDGDWNTSEFISETVVYTKPTNAVGGIWRVKDGDGEENLTIPDACWNYNLTDVFLQVSSGDVDGGWEEWRCEDGDIGITLRTVSPVEFPLIYEEGMYWNLTDSLLFNSTQEMTGILNSTTFSFDLPNIGNYLWNCLASDATQNAFGLNSTLTFTPNVSVISSGYTSSVIEYSQQTFNITVNKSEPTSTITPKFVYNGTSYTTGITNTTSGNQIVYFKSLNLSGVAAEINESKNFMWNFTIGFNGENVYQNASYNQTVSKMIMNTSTANGAVSSINYTCLDDTTRAAVNCTTIISYYLYSPENYGIGTFEYYSFTDSLNTSVKNHYKLPNGISDFTANITVVVSATGYPVKTIEFRNQNLSDTSINKNLSLTSTANGIYVTFQVVNPAFTPLSDVFINASVGGEIVASGLTDTAGSGTYWLNPNLLHYIIFSKASYADYNISIYPTQSSYTITLGSSGVNSSNYVQGVSWYISPTDNSLINGTTYDFTFNITSGYWSLDSYGFVLKDNESVIYISDSGTGGAGGNLYGSLNTMGNKTITMEYYWVVGGVYTNMTKTWSVVYLYKGGFSIMNFFDDFKNFSHSGFNDFSRTLVAFGIIILIAGLASYFGLNSPIAVMGLITALVWVFTIGGIIKLSPSAPTNYAAAILVTALFIGYWYWEETR